MLRAALLQFVRVRMPMPMANSCCIASRTVCTAIS
jgi:hypothetical protein